MQIPIKDIEILAPSPTNFIIKVRQGNSDGSESDVVYVGSAEYCFSEDFLNSSKINHSNLYYDIDSTQYKSYALFDLNDMLIGVNADFRKQDFPNVNYILAPSLENTNKKLANYIDGVASNKNAFIGYKSNNRVLPVSPSRKYQNGIYRYENNKDSIIKYKKKDFPRNVNSILIIEDIYNLDYSSQFEQVFSIPTFPAFNVGQSLINVNQELVSWGRYVNDFDNSLLSSTMFITPKQTLNAEYSTIKNNQEEPYKFMREYNRTKKTITTSGNLLIFNYIESLTLGTNQIIEDLTHLNDNSPSMNLYQHYSPEIVNVIDDGFGGTGRDSDFGTKRALHKANIFDIDLTNPGNNANEKNYDLILQNISENISDTAFSIDPSKINKNEKTKEIKNKLHMSINKQLQELVSEIIPAHTHLFKVITEQ